MEGISMGLHPDASPTVHSQRRALFYTARSGGGVGLFFRGSGLDWRFSVNS